MRGSTRVIALASISVAALVTLGTASTAAPIEGTPGFTATTATKHVTVIERTDLPDRAATDCGTAAVAPALVAETSTSADVTSAIITVGPATIFIGAEQTVEYHVVSGEITTTTLVTTTTTVRQTYQGIAAGDPCAAVVAIAATPAFTG